ncbi:MAG TPA: alpha/beta fold hydrolase [Thermoanaerobaculia bacterium]|nr:alpha/beta fold hydrolase [Thermoanaerobaculia bacterium]
MTEAAAVPHPEPSRPLSLTMIRGALRVLSATAPKVASRVAADLFLTPRRFAAPPREQEILAHGEPFTVPLGAASEVRAWRFGKGPTVILAHGWEGRGSQLTPFVNPLVERGYSVVTFDAPGHGASPGSRSSLPHFAWAVRGVADAIGAPHAIIAHSLGCAAATLALRDGLSVQRLVYIAPPLNPQDYTERFGDILGLDAATIQGMQMRIEERFARKWSDYSLEETARQLTTPLLVVHDRDDRDTYWHEGAALAKAWTGARLLTTQGLGHRRILRDAAVIEEVTRFVDLLA